LLDGIDFRLYGSSDAAVQALLAGDVDALAGLVPADAARIARAPNRRLVRSASFFYVQVLFNQKNAALGDVAVRRAISQTIDRRPRRGGPMGGRPRPEDGPTPPAISWATPSATPAPADPAGAGQALDAAGWHLDPASHVRRKGDQDLSLTLAAEDLEPY